MGLRNYLIDGVSGTGKTSVAEELQRRGHHVVHGDRELSYQGDPETGEPTDGSTHEHHIWRVDRVQALVAARDTPATFFCGGSRNFAKFVHLFDGVFVLDVDLATLHRRLDERDDPWGRHPAERALIVHRHRTKADLPHPAVIIDARPPIAHVVDEILRLIDHADGPVDRAAKHHS
ncbi:nucleoside kinase [Dactylosporangium vinaceum]|uniref:AAA family ATPase n=1 Tax=Dactylosporangium vinaceum TaxID=53362 RepID=A0ABV5M7J6_9ACTN|nr:AAA family ATPase [Dactylosporangium vinaceum]UAB95408.1 nucleoside kinase [Dactylosporangium vinaceum]